MLQLEWGWTVVIDLFMSGFGSCLFISIALLYLVAGKKYARAVRWGAWASFCAVAIGVFCLLLDVGRPFRAMWLFGSFNNFDSWMPRGAWALTCALLIFVLFAIFADNKLRDVLKIKANEDGSDKGGLSAVRKILAVLGICVGAFVTYYTGCLLESSGNIPFWASDMLPAKPGIILGIIVALLAAGTWVCVLQYFNGMLAAENATAVMSAQWVGASTGYYVVFVCLGLTIAASVASVIMAAMGKNIKVAALVACAAMIVAGLALRYLVIGAGAHNPLPSPAIDGLAEGVTFLFQ